MSTHRTANRLAPFLALALSLGLAGAAAAWSLDLSTEPPAVSPSDLGDAVELESFVDDSMATAMAEHHIPGSTISIVKDGAILLAKGYGFANLAERRPVVASETLFRIGSVTKLFTWTAVMQLVEQGKVDLHADINTYLSAFRVPATYSEPITMSNLMTHTAGFEDRGLGLSVIDADELRPLASFLATDMPARIYPPGKVTAYSNYGTTLAGYVVEQISGVPLEAYVEAHIFEPLGMHHSTLRQTLPAELESGLASSYANHTGEFEVLPREYFEIVPASGMSATATDMANFMIAHLQDGRFEDKQILALASSKEMHRQQFTNDPRVSGMTYGFAEWQLGDLRLITHRGTTNFEQFQSYLVLMPDQGVGIFVSFNGEDGGPARAELVQALLDRYYPQSPPSRAHVLAGSADEAGRFVGSYASTRRSQTTIEKFVGLIPLGVDVVANGDGTLSISGGPIGSEPRRFIEVGPLLFREIDGREEVAFAANGRGEITSMFVGSMPIAGFIKQAWWETSAFGLGMLCITMLVFLVSIIGQPIAAFRNRRRSDGRGRRGRVARGLAWLTSLLFLLFPIVLIAGLSNLESGVNSLARSALTLGLVASALTAALVIATALAWRSSYWGFAGRAHQIVTVLAAVAFIWFLNNWNLLGIRL